MGKSIRSKHQKALRSIRRETTTGHKTYKDSLDQVQAALAAAAAAEPLEIRKTGPDDDGMDVEGVTTRGRQGRRGATGMDVDSAKGKGLGARKAGGIVKRKGKGVILKKKKSSKMDNILAQFKTSKGSMVRKRKGPKQKH
mmetsp:Transcript_32000/g.101903  ORF Transcript_32000/g.101903 Transcript_32000/m.101903 type:complete len:140 (-) Transcript_32000:242-661(-)